MTALRSALCDGGRSGPPDVLAHLRLRVARRAARHGRDATRGQLPFPSSTDTSAAERRPSDCRAVQTGLPMPAAMQAPARSISTSGRRSMASATAIPGGSRNVWRLRSKAGAVMWRRALTGSSIVEHPRTAMSAQAYPTLPFSTTTTVVLA